jgi:hypothetical protein
MSIKTPFRIALLVTTVLAVYTVSSLSLAQSLGASLIFLDQDANWARAASRNPSLAPSIARLVLEGNNVGSGGSLCE